MATNNSVIGLLRVLLSASTAEFDSAMRRSADTAKLWSKELKTVGRQATEVGAALTRTLTLPIAGVGLAAAKLAMDFESSFAGVRKTVDGTEPELAALAQGFRDLSKTIPVNVNDLNRLGEAAGALGIPKDKIVEFAAVMAKLGVSTDLTADQAANAIARIQNIFGAAGKDTENLASTLVALGNAGASTEKEIVEMAQRIAGAGHTVGLTQAQVLAFASTLASVGINAEAGGSAISRVFLKINDAVQKGGSGLAEFARVAGVSSAQFKQAFETNAAGATQSFIEGLGRLKASGENINATIERLTGKNIILKDTLFRLSGAGALLNDQLKLADKAWTSNTALTKEAAERFKTTESRLILLGNKIKDVGITLGNALGPAIDAAMSGMNALIPVLETMAKTFGALPGSLQLVVVGLAGLTAAVGPLIYVFGQLALATSAVTGAFAAKGLASRVLLADLGFLATGVRTASIAAAAAVTQYGALGAASIGLTAVVRTLSAAIMAMPWAAAAAGIAAVTAAVVSYKTAAADAALATASAGAKQDVVNKALAQGAARNAEYTAASDKYAAAIQFNSRIEAIRIAQFDRSNAAQQRAIEAHLALGHITEKEAKASIAALEGKKQDTGATNDNTGAQHKNNDAKTKAVVLTSQQVQVLALLDKAHAHQAAALEMETAAWKVWEQTVSRALSSIATNPVLLQGRNLSGLVPQIGAAAATGGNLAGTPLAATAIGETLAGAMSKALQQLPQMLIAAFTGGGGVMGAVQGMGTLLGGTLGKSIGAGFKALGKFGGPIGEAIGALAGPLIGKLFDMFGSAGRDLVKEFAATFGGFDALHVQLNALGAEGERLWIALTQGVGKNNPQQAKTAIDAITAALEAQKAKTAEAAEAAVEASTKQQEALDAITAKYADSIAKIDSEYKSLSDSVAQEAEEDVMGLVEMQQRARMAELEAEKAAQEAMRDAEIAAKKETFNETLEHAQKLDEQLRELFARGYQTSIRFELPPGWPTTASSIPSVGALTASHEASPFAGSRAVNASASLTRAEAQQTIVVKLGERELIRTVARGLPGNLQIHGVGR
jgi:TP901 family phage tail tape measure protein